MYIKRLHIFIQGGVLVSAIKSGATLGLIGSDAETTGTDEPECGIVDQRMTACTHMDDLQNNHMQANKVHQHQKQTTSSALICGSNVWKFFF